MRTHIFIFAIASLAVLSAGCGAADPVGSGQDQTMTAPALTLTLEANELAAGQSFTVEVNVRNPAPDGGAVIVLSSSDVAALAMPETITIAAGDHTGRFAVANSYSGKPKSVIIVATYEGASAERRLYIPRTLDPICNLHFCL
jgi:hypothetical protein